MSKKWQNVTLTWSHSLTLLSALIETAGQNKVTVPFALILSNKLDIQNFPQSSYEQKPKKWLSLQWTLKSAIISHT